MIYFYFNTEIRYEVLRQVQRTLLSSETVRRSSAGETLSTRLSTFRRSISRNRQSSLQARNERRRMNQQNKSSPPPVEPPIKEKDPCLCPCWMKGTPVKKTVRIDEPGKSPMMEPMQTQENPICVLPDDDLAEIIAPLIGPMKGTIDNEGMTCDTVILKNEADDDEGLSDENDVTIQQSSFHAEPTSTTSNHSPIMLHRPLLFQRQRSHSDGCGFFHGISTPFSDRKSLK